MNTQSSLETSRRQFLRHVGIGVAGVSTLSRAIAQGTAANSRVRLGLVGGGERGQWIAGLFKEHGGYEIVGAADYFEDKVKQAAEKLALTPKQTFTGLRCAEKMIAAGGIDAVAIISPPYFRPMQARAVVDAGLHAYLAKPIAVDVPGCDSIRASGEKARRQGRAILVDFQTRTNEFYIEAMRRLHSGAVGNIVFGEGMFQASRLAIKTPPGTPEARLRNWVFDQALSGDIVVEQDIHMLDVMSWAMKETPPVRCSGTGGRRVRVDVGDCWDNYELLYEYANNVGMTFIGRQFDAFGEPGALTNRIFATGGVLSAAYGGNVMLRAAEKDFYRGGNCGDLYKAGAIANIQTFHRAIMNRDFSNPTIEPSLTSNLIAIMGRMAAQEKRTITWAEVLGSTKTLAADLSGLHA